MRKVCLAIIDGFGISDESDADATKYAKFIESVKATSSWVRLRASGEYVGLPEGFSGNSEVGHMTIGSGRRIEQSLPHINRMWREGHFARRMESLTLSPRVHMVGLLSDGGVHSHIEHLRFLLACIPGRKFVHAIADGIDTQPSQFFKHAESVDCEIVSISGRYYAMDRDGNVDRIRRVFAVMTSESCGSVPLSLRGGDVRKRIADCPELPAGEKEQFAAHAFADEYIPPVRIVDEPIRPDDTVIFYNFRADRMRQLAGMFKDFARVYTMTDYGLGSPFRVIFESLRVNNTLPEWFARHSMTQAHIAESEKYAHVTYFFNGGCEARQQGEVRVLVKSPSLNGFDEQPGTSMHEVLSECISVISQSIDFVLVNLAAPDLVGHSGNLQAAIQAVEEVDKIIETLHAECLSASYTLVVTADHGNAEQMVLDGRGCKSHTLNDVPLLLIGAADGVALVSSAEIDKPGELADVAPTILDLMDLPAPGEMSGRSLLSKKHR